MASAKQLTLHLKQLAKEAHSIHDDGAVITRSEALATLVWSYALGWEEEDPDNKEKKILHRPNRWAIELLWDRLEGKVASGTDDDAGTMTAADKVGEQAKNRVNALTVATLHSKPGGPPRFKPEGER